MFRKVSPVGNFRIYPNPVTDILYVENNNIEFDLDISLKDIQGRIIKRQIVKSGEQVAGIDIQDLLPGLYFYECRSGNGEIFTGKFIKL